ncbi:Acetyltransferase involved in cellulose biosynthesis, CelD/BcsL family [Roseovarius lutimaris]|uniref:Acetyltransferase involved in cellulose biosynthesis, CelD/BcsL family n=1 Tax=Roseovarius lutimaris TaxID=1005928 RepID=A0A1I5CF95_9RHOB|nr:GNAT family N-acetyltransferase [Roseovarius lutimaris]SFN85301.1 Acetyltransferase involved in cellulose biosynthesis, CelD/BcsL family [Roseovarius lutimaris]
MKHNQIKPVPDTALQVSIIDSYADFVKLRDAWQGLERRDPESTVFLTWDWMAQIFRDRPFRWSVLVVRDPARAGDVLCILPLKYRVHWSTSRKEFQTELEAAGRLLWSEYTGFLCNPAHEVEALTAAAGKLARMPWTKLSMRYVAQHRRCTIFTEALADQGFSVRFRDYLINNKETNNLLCPQVELPEDFDTYLKTQLSSNTRQKFNRFRRKSLDTGDYNITCADNTSFESDLEALLTFWKQKWSAQKGEEQAERVAANYRDVLTAAQRTGTLFMPVLRKGNTPLGALGHVLDVKNGLMHFIVAGRDFEAKETFIGSAMHFHSIEWAIAQGYICYDFCHGNEAYKYNYGAQDHDVLYFEVRRKNLRDDLVLDSICIGDAMRRVETFLSSGKIDHAARACAQIAKLFS